MLLGMGVQVVLTASRTRLWHLVAAVGPWDAKTFIQCCVIHTTLFGSAASWAVDASAFFEFMDWLPKNHKNLKGIFLQMKEYINQSFTKSRWYDIGRPIPGSHLWLKKGKILLFNGYMYTTFCTAPGANMLSTNSWLIIVLLVWVKTYRSLKSKFFIMVKNEVHVAIGHVCDFARKWALHQNDFKLILWCVIVLSNTQMMEDKFTNNFILHMKFYHQDFFWCNILYGHVCDILV